MADPAATSGPIPSGSGYARHVGRVGGLAFALGVGFAVLAGTGVAQADNAASGTAGSETSSARSQETDNGPGAAGPQATTRAKPTARTGSASVTGPESERGRPARRPSRSVDQLPAQAVARASAAAEEVVPLSPKRPSAGRAATAAPSTEIKVAAPAAEAVAVAAAVAPNPFFNNQTPTLNHDPLENTVVDGHIHGDLHPVDPDSAKLTFTATKPALGTVKIDPSGTFEYTPGVNFDGQDMFQVTVSDQGSGFHIHGFAGLLNLLSFGLLGSSGHKHTETVFIGQQRTVVASGLSSPVDFRFLPDGRILVAEKGGAIKVVKDGEVLAQPLMTLSVNTVSERGISGLAVDPQFATNGHIYVAYTTSAIKDRLSRFTVVGDTAAPGTELLLMETPDTVAGNHHGGALDFGPDGKLYWGKGDNAVPGNSQNLTNMYGKILRLNPDGSTPLDNPVLGPGSLPQIYAYGLRNPFRLTFTPTGELLVADVGSNAYEELNRVTAGGNYGWPGAEGICNSNCAGLIDPVYAYPRGSGAAFTAVAVYGGSKVLIADLVQGWVKVLTCNPAFTSCGSPQDFDADAGTTVALTNGPGNDSSLYQLIYQPGTLVRIDLTSDA